MPLDLTAQLWIDGAWTTKAGYSERGGWDFQIGPAREGELEPSKVGFTFENDDLQLDPSNVQSTLYGKIGRNTKMRLRIDGNTVTQAEIASWQPTATSEHSPTGVNAGSVRGVAFTGVTAEGLLRRLQKWTDLVQSPMRRNISSWPGLLGWYPLEDPAGAARLEQAVSGLPSGRYAGTVTLGETGPAGAISGMKIGSDALVAGGFRSVSDTEWEVSWAAQLNTVPSSGTYETIMRVTDTVGRTHEIMVNNTNYRLLVTSSTGVSLMDNNTGWNVSPVLWTRFMLRCTTESGSLSRDTLQWYSQDDGTIFTLTNTFSSTSTAMPGKFTINGNAWNTDATYSHVTATTDTTGYPFQSNGIAAFNGHRDERAALRIFRLMSEQGLTSYFSASYGLSKPMGPQPPGTLIDLLQQCVLTDGGVLFDEPTDIALTYRSLLDLTSKTPSLSLTKSQIRYPLGKVLDDANLANLVTVTNADGTRAVAQLDEGPISTQAPPDGIGLSKFDLDVNMADADAIVDRAEYELTRRTIDRPRYPQVSVDLFANPSLASTVTAMRPGDWIVLTDVEPDDVYLRVMQIQRSGDTVRDVVTFNCVPADALQVAIIDNADHRRDSATTTLQADIDDNDTSIVITTSNPAEYWSTTDVPYDWKIGIGERVTVTSITSPSSGQQTATVTRSVNGIVTSHSAGAVVSLADPVRIGL